MFFSYLNQPISKMIIKRLQLKFFKTWHVHDEHPNTCILHIVISDPYATTDSSYFSLFCTKASAPQKGILIKLEQRLVAWIAYSIFLMLKAKQTWNNCTSSDLLKVNTCFDIWNEAGAWPKPAEAVQLVVVYFSTYLFDHILEDTNKQLRSILTQTTGLTFLIGHTENKNNTSNLFPIYKTNNGDQSV